MIKKRFVTSIFAILAFGFSSSLIAQKQVIDKVVATVGSEYILLSELEEQYALMAAQNGGLPDGARCEILSQMMMSKLLLDQARLDSIEVTAEEIEYQLTARIDRILEYMQGDISQFEAYYGQSISEVKEQFRTDLENQVLTERMRGELIKGITVTPSEVKDYFNKIPKDSLPYFNAEVEVSEIVYMPQVNEVERQKAILQLTQVRQDITENGKSFEEMAARYSQDGSGRMGGDLGWAKRGKFVPEFEAAAYKLEKGEVSPIVETEFGFHIIQLIERRGNSIHARHILIRPQITEDDVAKAYAHLDSVRHLILSDSISFSEAVKEFSDDQASSYHNNGRIVNPATGNTFFETGDLDPDIYFAIDTLEINGVTSPIEFNTAVGTALLKLIKLDSSTSPHKASLEQDYSKIQQAAIQSKQGEYLNKWVLEKANSTYIAIDPDFKSCEALNALKMHNLR